MHKIHYSFDSL